MEEDNVFGFYTTLPLRNMDLSRFHFLHLQNGDRDFYLSENEVGIGGNTHIHTEKCMGF